jgi:hypothetical protein
MQEFPRLAAEKRAMAEQLQRHLGAFGPIFDGSIHRFLAAHFKHLADAIFGDLANVKRHFGKIGDLPSEWFASVMHYHMGQLSDCGVFGRPACLSKHSRNASSMPYLWSSILAMDPHPVHRAW